jgi:hypothetical protein
MPSQLSLRITSQFDKSGFDAARSQIRDFSTGLRDINTKSIDLRSSLTSLGQTLIGIFAVRQIQQFTDAAIEEERILTTLGNRFALLGEAGKQTAEGFRTLTTALSESTRFSQTEQLQAVNTILRTAKSSSDAARVLAVAQDVAAASGVSLAQASFAIGRAQQGTVRQLSLITGLTREQIKEFEKQGNLIDKLGEKFRGFAQRDAQTLGGAFDIIANKSANAGQTLGQLFVPALTAVANSLKVVDSTTVASSLAFGTVATALLGAAGAAALLGPQLAAIGAALLAQAPIIGIVSIGIAGATKAYLDYQKALEITKEIESDAAASTKNFADAIKRARGELDSNFVNASEGVQKLRQEIAALNHEIANAPSSLKQQLLADRAILREQLRNFQEARSAEVKLGELDTEKLIKQHEQLTLGKLNAELLFLAKRRQLVDAELVIVKKGSDQEKDLLLERENIDLQLSTTAADADIANSKRRQQAAEELLSIFKSAVPGVANIDQATSKELLVRRAAILQEVKLEQDAADATLTARLDEIQKQQSANEISSKEAAEARVRAELEAEARIATAKKSAATALAPIEQRLPTLGVGVATVSDQLARQADELQRKLRLQTTFILKVDDDSLVKIQKDTETTLRRFGFSIREAVTNTIQTGAAEGS